MILLYMVLLYVFDIVAAHFSYFQFKNKTNSIKRNIIEGFSWFHIYVIHRILQLLFFAIPLIIEISLIFIVSLFVQLNQFTPPSIIISLLIFYLLILVISLAMSFF